MLGHSAQSLRVNALRERVEGEVEPLAVLHVLQQPRHLAKLREREAVVRRARGEVHVAAALDFAQVKVQPAKAPCDEQLRLLGALDQPKCRSTAESATLA